MSKNYVYNLRELETKALSAYGEWVEADNQTTRTNIFKTVYNLAYAILDVNQYFKKKFSLDKERTEQVSYEYALYLFDRIVFKGFRLDPKTKKKNILETRFPLQRYIHCNLRHVLDNYEEKDKFLYIVEDFEEILKSQDSKDTTEIEKIKSRESLRFSKKYLASNILESLKMYYDMGEIRRLFPFASDIFSNQEVFTENKNIPKDLYDFMVTFSALAYRLMESEMEGYISNFSSKDSFNAALRSSVFLSSISNDKNFPRELMMALDINSLYRLVNICGGKRLKVPSIKELNKLVLSTRAVSDSVINNKDLDDILPGTVKEMELSFSRGLRVQKFASNLEKSLNLFGEDNHSEPIINILLVCLDNLNKVFKDLEAKADVTTSKELSEVLLELSEGCGRVTESILRISEHLHQPNNEEGKDA